VELDVLGESVSVALAARVALSPFSLALGIPFYRHKGIVQLYIWGCSNVLTCPAKRCLSPV
jgi:hypothetical protein